MQTCKICDGKGWCDWWDIGEKVAGWVCQSCQSLYGIIVCYQKMREFVLPENIGFRPELPPLDPDSFDPSGII